ncbi:MAG: hypothetical protein LBI45_04940 [Bacteroidales bacterium]|jgi:hypothetical protein|nr:hypothetical protein [Bacteroidales bacterium]
MKKLSIIAFILLMAVPFFSFGQNETKTSENSKPEKFASYTFINEYGIYFGNTVGFTSIFVNGVRFNKTQDVLGIGIGYEIDTYSESRYYWIGIEGAQNVPIFINYRHYFPGKRAFKPLVNVATGIRLNFWREYSNGWIWIDNPYYDSPYYFNEPYFSLGFYGTVAAGFKVKALSFTSGFFLKSWDGFFYGGMEMKVGFTF